MSTNAGLQTFLSNRQEHLVGGHLSAVVGGLVDQLVLYMYS